MEVRCFETNGVWKHAIGITMWWFQGEGRGRYPAVYQRAALCYLYVRFHTYTYQFDWEESSEERLRLGTPRLHARVLSIIGLKYRLAGHERRCA